MSNSKDTVLINRAPDGEHICVLGVRETIGPDTPMELEPVANEFRGVYTMPREQFNEVKRFMRQPWYKRLIDFLKRL